MLSKKKLANRVLHSISVRVTAIIFISAIFSYFHLYSTIEKGTIQTLKEYVRERAEKESFVFKQAKKNHVYITSLLESFVKGKITRKLHSKDFNTYFEKKEDGTYRNKKNYDGTKMAGLFIPPDYSLTNNKKELIVYLKELAETFGPAFRSNFQDTYFTTPNNVMVIFWPEVPNWTMDIAPDFNMANEEYVWIADKKHNPERKTVWTGLFYDKVGKVWMSSAETPFYHNDEHLLTIGHDVMLSELLKRAQNESLPGAYNVIFRKDGRLIVHPDEIDKLKNSNGYFDINKSGSSFLKNLKETVLNSKNVENVVQSGVGNELFAFEKIDGPDWYFVTVYPKSLITSTALKGIMFVIFIALLSLILEVLLFWFVIKNEISKPIEKLFQAAEKIKKGQFNTRVDLKRDDELGTFADTFNAMLEAISERDKEIHDYANALEKKVAVRTRELDHQRALSAESAKMASLGEMAGGIAHEINNPLAVISGSVSLIIKSARSGEVNPERLDRLSNTTQKTIKRIENIVGGLRTFARSGEQDQFKLESFHEIAQETLSLGQHKIKMLNIDMEVLVDKENDIFINCQKVQVSQVLLNLISNAADSIKNQKNRKWIKVSFSESNDLIQIRVEDSGTGIPKDIQSKVFRPFFTTKEVGSGTGLGLSISSRIMKHHDGKLFIDNDLENTCLVMEFLKTKQQQQKKVG